MVGLAFGEFWICKKRLCSLVLRLEHHCSTHQITEELTKPIRQYIPDGLTACDCCFGVGISEDAFCRWRREKPKFAKLVQETTEAQRWSSIGLARTSEYRRYTRRMKHTQNQEKNEKRSSTRLGAEDTLETPLNASEGHSLT